MMACVVAWFCECGSMVRMSFCAAHFSVTAWSGAAASASMRSQMRMFPPLFERQGLLGERGEIPGAERNYLVVEIIIRVVQQTAAGGAALAEEHVGTGALLQKVGEILAAHGRLMLGYDVLSAEHALADIGGKAGLARTVDRGGGAARVGGIAGGAEGLGGLGGDLAHAALGEVACLRLEGAHRADELHMVGDDVEHANLARGKRANADDDGVDRVDAAAGDGLKCGVDERCHDH